MRCNAPKCTTRVRWVGNDKWQCHSARWKDNGSFENLPQWHLPHWVRPRMSKRLSVSKWKQELTERSHKSNHKLTHPLCIHLYMDPSSQRSRGWNFTHCKELLLVLRQISEYWVIYALLEVKRGFFAGRLMLGQESSIVTPPGSSCLSMKTIWVSPTCLCINDVLLYLHV